MMESRRACRVLQRAAQTVVCSKRGNGVGKARRGRLAGFEDMVGCDWSVKPIVCCSNLGVV